MPPGVVATPETETLRPVRPLACWLSLFEVVGGLSGVLTDVEKSCALCKQPAPG